MIPSQKGGRKIGNVTLESCSKILEEIRKIQNPVQFTGREQNLGDNKQDRI